MVDVNLSTKRENHAKDYCSDDEVWVRWASRILSEKRSRDCWTGRTNLGKCMRMRLELRRKCKTCRIIVQTVYNSKLSKAIPVQLGIIRKGKECFSNSWAAVSSRDVFRAVTQVARASHLQVMIFVAISSVITSLASLPADFSTTDSPEGTQFKQSVCGVCSKESSLCCFAWDHSIALAILCTGLCVYGILLTNSLNLEMWSPSVTRACDTTKTVWLKRCLRTHWYTHVIQVVAFLVYIAFIRMKFLASSMIELLLYPFGVLFVIVFQGVIIFRNFGLDISLWQKLKQSIWPGKVVPAAALSGFEESEYQCEASKRLNSGKDQPQRSLLTTDYSGFRHWQLGILMSLMFTTIPSALGSPYTLAAIWIIRIAYIVVLLRVHDHPATFQDLEESGAGFGLVIDAEQIKAAINEHLNGGFYRGAMQRYRASYFRMQDTLCLSYRWQTEEKRIHPDFTVNMSLWQLKHLLKAIAESKCLYVWIDKLSVPQSPCKLQKTLLARMMAIYATSKETLILRSAEAPSHRYHQRAWTLQEYCCSRHLRMITEEEEDTSIQNLSQHEGRLAVDDEEQVLFPELRQWHQSRGNSCKPYWLYGLEDLSNTAEVQEILDKLHLLSARVVCQVLTDKVRALYPMFFNIPLENEKELERLVSQVMHILEREVCESNCDIALVEQHRSLIRASLNSSQSASF